MKERILYEMEKAYTKVVWILKDDFLERSAFDRAIRRLNMNSSPGYPYQLEATSNGDWLKWNGVTCDAIQLNRLWHDVQCVFAGNWEHILRVFVKQEPHKMQKVEDGRWRLIMASALSVQICWHMLFDEMNDLEIQHAYSIPSQQGIILVSGGWKLFTQSWEEAGLSCGLDKTAWDWTAPYWTLEMDLQFRYRMARGDRLEEWLDKARYLYHHMYNCPEIMTSDGSCFRQIVPGIMKSGCVNTISTNSHCQLFVHMAVCMDAGWNIHPLPVACGDDTLQHVNHTVDISLYAKYGVYVKSISNTVEFVGHEFDSNGPKPMYLYKHFKKMHYIAEENLAQYFDSMARMYIHTEYYKYWEHLAFVAGYPLPLSRQSYLYWYDYSD